MVISRLPGTIPTDASWQLQEGSDRVGALGAGGGMSSSSSDDLGKPRRAAPQAPARTATSPFMRQSRIRASTTRKDFMNKNSLAARWNDGVRSAPSSPVGVLSTPTQADDQPRETAPNQPWVTQRASLRPSLSGRYSLRRISSRPDRALAAAGEGTRMSARMSVRMSKLMSKRIFAINADAQAKGQNNGGECPISPSRALPPSSSPLTPLAHSPASPTVLHLHALSSCVTSLYPSIVHVCVKCACVPRIMLEVHLRQTGFYASTTPSSLALSLLLYSHTLGLCTQSPRSPSPSRLHPALFRTLPRADAVLNKLQENYRECERSLFAQQKRIVLISILSLFVAILINEQCAAGDYRTDAPLLEEQLELERPDRQDRECVSSLAMPLKLGSFALAALLIALATRRFRTQQQAHTLRVAIKSRSQTATKHLKGAALHNAHVKSVWPYLYFLMELLMLAVHPPPLIEKDIGVDILGTRIFYRLESIACALMLPRTIEVT